MGLGQQPGRVAYQGGPGQRPLGWPGQEAGQTLDFEPWPRLFTLRVLICQFGQSPSPATVKSTKDKEEPGFKAQAWNRRAGTDPLWVKDGGRETP